MALFDLHSHILINPSHIQLCEVFHAMKLADKVQNERKGVVIIDSHCIEGAITLDDMQPTIFLLNKKDWKAIGDLEGQM